MRPVATRLEAHPRGAVNITNEYDRPGNAPEVKAVGGASSDVTPLPEASPEPYRIETRSARPLAKIPSFFESMPDSTLENEWNEFKVLQLTDTKLSVREKQLIGYAVAAALHCPYCTYFHEGVTKMFGSTGRRSSKRPTAWPARPPSTAPICTACRSRSTTSNGQADEIGRYAQAHMPQSESKAA